MRREPRRLSAEAVLSGNRPPPAQDCQAESGRATVTTRPIPDQAGSMTTRIPAARARRPGRAGGGTCAPAAFIVFAIRQQHAAEAFGFTRNEACRNLKTALHQYWQHKTLRQHGQARKASIPRSRAASKRPLSECVVEHAVPQMEIVNRLMALDPLTESRVTRLLRKFYTVLLVTKEEHARLNASGVRSAMPKDWDGRNVFARYNLVGIEPATVDRPEATSPPKTCAE